MNREAAEALAARLRKEMDERAARGENPCGVPEAEVASPDATETNDREEPS